ncbi:tRNA epoxyqueuosine(34) reductase QueG [Gloeobacter morelensis]|uniref:Epoxyqueuosine reductase n=1 Tax=Gloeobacter morelensis MG652769 TaxID=2781736 RepID=A0ABY3PL18_9CYAN|nr:tRNA epoxyqueuosine(34) reductase QueG [Gloeobacter morelensis]UFP94317.1 tRNA epoxyqueuosine(34) reductase QueG [Gloeobacter morelensis MG652769]
MAPTAAQIKSRALDLGFHKVGIARADALDGEGSARLIRWLAAGYAGEMGWMHDPRRRDIRQVLPGVRSVICVALNYNTPQGSPAPGQARISRYALGRDYHKVLSKPLKALARWIEVSDPGCRAIAYVDTGPIQEKAWAEAAGIGWIGKNACLITPEYGSWVFLGEILSTLDLEADNPHPNYCGTCTRCLSACPTAALVEPAVVDARKCLAYHTIENRTSELPAAIAERQHGWVVGCDLCQTCCPFNLRAERWGRYSEVADFAPRDPWNDITLDQLANLSDAEFERWSAGSAIRRVRAGGLRRNARSALGASGDSLAQAHRN